TLPLGLAAARLRRTFHRDLYFDTPAGDLRRRGITCGMRFDADDRRALALEMDMGALRYVTPVVELEPREAFRGDAEPARRLRGLVDPERLVLVCELEVERELRGATQDARQIAVLAVAHGRLALWRSGAALELPLEPGGGEETCRQAMRRLFGSVEGETRLIGVVRAADRRPAVEVWLVRRLRRNLTAAPHGGLQWFTPADVIARVGSPVLRDPTTLSALAVAARSELVPEWSAAPLAPLQPTAPTGGTTDESSRLTLSELRVPALPRRALD